MLYEKKKLGPFPVADDTVRFLEKNEEPDAPKRLGRILRVKPGRVYRVAPLKDDGAPVDVELGRLFNPDGSKLPKIAKIADAGASTDEPDEPDEPVATQATSVASAAGTRPPTAPPPSCRYGHDPQIPAFQFYPYSYNGAPLFSSICDR